MRARKSFALIYLFVQYPFVCPNGVTTSLEGFFQNTGCLLVQVISESLLLFRRNSWTALRHTVGTP